MMAKMFYTMDETKDALNKSEEEIKQYAREGRLREFRDGPRLMFKSDQVDALKNDLESGGSSAAGIDLASSDTGISLGLQDSAAAKSGTGSGMGLSLADTDGGRSPGAGMTLKEDTALASDLGLSGSVSGMPSPGRSVGSGTGISGSQASRSGIDVFHSDEVERVDPMAQTSVSPNISEQVNLEGVGSGSGLLDLTRESDDTSLGADLLDEIAPSPRRGMGDTAAGASGIGSAMGGSAISSGMGTGLDEPRGGVVRGGAVRYVEAADPLAAAFAWAGLGAALMLIFTAFVLTCGLLGWHPDFLGALASKNFIIVAAGSLVAPVIFFFIGLILGRVGT